MSNDTLPVAAFRRQIVDSVRNHSVTIITAETGAGKSTQVPQYLMDEGLRVVVTQPRRLAARTVAERVAFERGTEFGTEVGYRTGFERCDSRDTQCLFVTDGLALVRELALDSECDVLVLDEVHEWNVNMEILVAWVKIQVAQYPRFRVVIMSATMEAKELSCYFNDAPVISVPGRLFPVTEKQRSFRMEDDVKALVSEGRNVLVFQPGKAEIAEMVRRLQSDSTLDAEIVSLHGDLEPAEQARAFMIYSRPKVVVSTNVAQTSVTIPDIDAVVDSGMERRIELLDSVETLTLAPISVADSKQRMGRAGRTKPGVYIDHCEVGDRLEFPRAEILRVRLDQAVLRLAEFGLDLEEMELFHQPDKREIHEAKRALRALGCLDGNRVTEIGSRVAKLPVSCAFGRMVVEADRLGVVDDILSIAAILEQGGINARLCPSCKESGFNKKYCSCWKERFAPMEQESDVLAQLRAFNACRELKAPEMHKYGIYVKAYFHAYEIRQKLSTALRGFVRRESSGDRDAIMKALCAGMVDHLYFRKGYEYVSGDGEVRTLDMKSLLSNTKPQWIVGLPFNLKLEDTTLLLVRLATAVDPKWLMEVAPQLVRIERGEFQYDMIKDRVLVSTSTFFADHPISSEWVEDKEHPELPRLREQYKAERERYLKRNAEILLRNQIEDMWYECRKPVLPSVGQFFTKEENLKAVVPIEIIVYGRHPVTGEELRGFGTWCFGGFGYDGEPVLEQRWTRNPVEVQIWADSVVKAIPRVKALREQKHRENLEKQRLAHKQTKSLQRFRGGM